MSSASVIILAGGKGTRLGGDTPKPLVPVLGRPLIQPVIEQAQRGPWERIAVVISDHTAAVKERFPHERLTYVHTAPLGTGHGVLEALKEIASERVVIVQSDDSHFYPESTLEDIAAQSLEDKAVMTVGVAEITYDAPYASVQFDQATRRVEKILKSLDDLQIPPPKFIAAGLYAAETAWLKRELEEVPFNAKGERSLPPVIDAALRQGLPVSAYVLPSDSWYGVNTPEELERAAARASLASS